MNFEDTLIRTGRSLISGVESVWSEVRQTWGTVRSKIKELWGSFRALIEIPADHLEADEGQYQNKITDAVRSVLGENPLQALRDCSVNERKEIVSELVEEIAVSMGVEAPDVSIQELQKNVMGYYCFDQNQIVINLSAVTCHPMELDEAAELLDTVLHELYHDFQHHAMTDPERYGISCETARLWQQNFENYISPEQNSYLYFEQPVEASARSFAHSVLLQF